MDCLVQVALCRSLVLASYPVMLLKFIFICFLVCFSIHSSLIFFGFAKLKPVCIHQPNLCQHEGFESLPCSIVLVACVNIQLWSHFQIWVIIMIMKLQLDTCLPRKRLWALCEDASTRSGRLIPSCTNRTMGGTLFLQLVNTLRREIFISPLSR